MPDPITKATWDNYLMVSPKRAKDLNDELTGFSEVESKKRVVTVKGANGYSVNVPILPVPGMPDNVVALAVGFGRDAKVGRAAASDATKGGKNAYPFRTFNGLTFDNFTTVTVTGTAEKYDIAQTQTQMCYETRPVIHEFTLAEFAKDPLELMKERGHEIGEYSHLPWEEEEHKEGHAVLADSTVEEGYR